MIHSNYYSPPSPSAYVEKYISLEQAEGAANSSKELVLPDGTAGLMIVTSGSITRAAATAQNTLSAKAYIFGQKTKAVSYQLSADSLCTFGAKLKPQALHQLFGIKATACTNQLIDIETLIGTKAKILEEQISEAFTIQEKITVLEQTFQQLHQHTLKHEALMIAMLQDIKNCQGNISMAQLAGQYHCSYKFLERLFKRFIGINPKLYARIIRFNSSFHAFEQQPFSKLTDIAYHCGYFDQMHFIKEVQAFSGRNPSDLYVPPAGPIEKTQWNFMVEKGR